MTEMTIQTLGVSQQFHTLDCTPQGVTTVDIRGVIRGW